MASSAGNSTVTFRKQQGTAREQVRFHGDGIRLLDLKREILSLETDKGKTQSSLDFDYEIKEESTNAGTLGLAAASFRGDPMHHFAHHPHPFPSSPHPLPPTPSFRPGR